MNCIGKAQFSIMIDGNRIDHRPDAGITLDSAMEKPTIVIENPSPAVARPPTRSGRKVRRPQWYGIPFEDY